jgi:lipopolysaccharide transport system ATP-binding protein
MGEVAIRVAGLSKKYRIGKPTEQYGRLTESLWSGLTAPFRSSRGSGATTDFWALRDVSFDIARGSAVGVIGRNGAGKSTLLKILSRITEPTSGRAELSGRVGSLLEVGPGFHSELPGRENISLSGAILGMRRAEIARRFDEIIDFADIGPFLETPIKRYSSGMKVRLGFAVAAFLEPEILFVDEVLAVGDADFQRKCVGKMAELGAVGRTVVFVSHNMAAIENLCTHAILLEHGQVVANGPAATVINQYAAAADRLATGSLDDRKDRQGDGRLRFVGIDAAVRLGAASEIRIEFEAQPGLRKVEVSVGVFTLRGEGAMYLGNQLTGDDFSELPPSGAFVCRLDRSALSAGIYSVNLFATVGGSIADWVQEAARIEVAEGDYYGTGRTPPIGYGHVVVDQRWTVETR